MIRGAGQSWAKTLGTVFRYGIMTNAADFFDNSK